MIMDVTVRIFLLNVILISVLEASSKHHHAEEEEEEEYTTIYSSCSEIEQDGLYYIKPKPELPVLPVICSNHYAMLDGSLDLNMRALPYFLTSYDYGRVNKYYTLSGLDDLSTFREWFIPADSTTKFNVAPQCLSCSPGDFDDDTVYYIDSHTFCFSGQMTTGCIDDTKSRSYHPESCNTCDSSDALDDDGMWYKCNALQLDADHEIVHDHISCVAHGLTFHPVISFIRDACTCFKPGNEENGVIEYKVSMSDLPLVTSSSHELERYGFVIADNIKFDETWSKENDVGEIQDLRKTNIVYLYQSDFMDGTYRIRKSGTYIIMEDIVFNFNAPTFEEMSCSDFSPNSIDVDELYWYPTHEQAHPVHGEYPGLYTYSGSFTLGFFAGITIETDYVSIDLNGFELSQDPIFYFQQRFFALIELASQPFVPGQGPANWGSGTDVYANYVDIKNGNLGLSSHHGIHGNNNNFVTISNIKSYKFDVAGIQCNACTNLLILDCQIGPQNDEIPLLGRYTHSRAFIPRLKELMDKNGDDVIEFYNRDPILVSTLIDRLISQMDMMYFHFINGVQYDDINDAEWIAAKKLFFNPSGWMDGGSSYGILIGGDGAQVVGIGARHDSTSDVTIKNVEIFGIYNKVIEKVKFTADFGATRLIFFDAIDWMATSDQVYDVDTSQYVGDAYTDLTFAISQVVDSWYFMNSLYVSYEMSDHVFDGDNIGFKSIFKQPGYKINKPDDEISGCGSDIQLHSSKGAIGLRVDGTQNLLIDELYIHDVYNWADLGSSTWCGPYAGPTVGNEDIDIQYGYTGTRAHGFVIDYAQGTISNIRIQNVESYHGEANGMTIYKECDLVLENILVDNIHAGSQLITADAINNLESPNLTPRACGLDIRPNTVVQIRSEINGLTIGTDVTGFETCLDAQNNQNIQNKNEIISRLFVTVTLISVIFIFAYCIKIIYTKYYSSSNMMKMKMNNNHFNLSNEYTPLLY